MRVERTIVALGVAAGALLTSVSPAVAQEVPDRLTLDDAVRLAERHNPAYRQSLYRLETAEIERRRGFNNAFLPDVSTGIQFQGNTFREYVAEDFVGEPLDEPYYSRAESSTARQSLGLTMQLFSGPNLMRYRSARASARNVAAVVDAETYRVRADVARRYYLALQADAGIALEERLLASAREHLDATERLFAIGAADVEDVLGARLEVVTSENALSTAVGNARRARLDLLEVMGVSDGVEVRLVDELPEPFDPDLLDVDALVAEARRASPRIRQAEAGLDASAASLRASRASYWPTVTAFGGVRRQRTVQGFDAFGDVNPREWGYNVSLVVNIPIPVLQFNTSADIAAARVQEADAREALRAARLSIERDVRAAVLELEQAYGDLEVAEERADLSRQRVALQEERLRSGAQVSFTDLERLREAAAQAERAVLNAVIAFQNNLLALEELVAREVRP